MVNYAPKGLGAFLSSVLVRMSSWGLCCLCFNTGLTAVREARCILWRDTVSSWSLRSPGVTKERNIEFDITRAKLSPGKGRTRASHGAEAAAQFPIACEDFRLRGIPFLQSRSIAKSCPNTCIFSRFRAIASPVLGKQNYRVEDTLRLNRQGIALRELSARYHVPTTPQHRKIVP